MTQTNKKPKGLKISQLAKQAGVSIPTIKHYLREDLLPRPIKTGRTMSYYDHECVERVRLIKKLQTERFLPLSLIKKMIDSGELMESELALGEALLKIPPYSTHGKSAFRKDIAEHTGYPLSKIDKIEAAGLIQPRKTPRGKEYNADDCQVISLVKQREEAGLPFDHSLELMSIYRKHIKHIVLEDAKLFVRKMLKNTKAADAARYIREGDRALGAFMPIIKSKLVADNAEKTLRDMNLVGKRLKEALRFRILQNTQIDLKNQGKSEISDMDYLTILAAAGVSSPDEIRLDALDKNHMDLALGLNDLSNGRADAALKRFNKMGKSGATAGLAMSLAGLAHIEQIPGAPGILPPVEIIEKALSCFGKADRSKAESTASILSTYFQGVGFAIIPEVFDTHRKASEKLNQIISQMDMRRPDQSKPSLWEELSREIRIKALYFEAEMHINDERFEDAEISLISIKKMRGPAFYAKWAQKQLKNIMSN